MVPSRYKQDTDVPRREVSDQRAAGPISEHTREETVTEPHRLHGSRVLVVDDEEGQAFALALLLREDEGILATSARDSNEALEQVKTSPIDAVVLDVKMPGLSGPDLLAVLRKLMTIESYVVVRRQNIDSDGRTLARRMLYLAPCVPSTSSTASTSSAS